MGRLCPFPFFHGKVRLNSDLRRTSERPVNLAAKKAGGLVGPPRRYTSPGLLTPSRVCSVQPVTASHAFAFPEG